VRPEESFSEALGAPRRLGRGLLQQLRHRAPAPVPPAAEGRHLVGIEPRSHRLGPEGLVLLPAAQLGEQRGLLLQCRGGIGALGRFCSRCSCWACLITRHAVIDWMHRLHQFLYYGMTPLSMHLWWRVPTLLLSYWLWNALLSRRCNGSISYSTRRDTKGLHWRRLRDNSHPSWRTLGDNERTLCDNGSRTNPGGAHAAITVLQCARKARRMGAT
jgi:hypothetical protein